MRKTEVFMKRIALTALFFVLMPTVSHAQSLCRASSSTSITPLFELYTSEGCSSCPPADRWLSSAARSIDPSKANYLAFHVDYWDDIGWPDRFAQAKFSERQRNRVSTAGGSTVYTPQVMQGRDVTVSWHQPVAIKKVLMQNQQQAALVNIDLVAQPSAQHWRTKILVRRTSKQIVPASVYLALYEDGLSTQVRAGENRGETLKHDRVVRGLFGPWPLLNNQLQKELAINIPDNVNVSKAGLVAFVQSAPYNQNLQSLKLELNHCAAAAK
jgi:hypothetical protein